MVREADKVWIIPNAGGEPHPAIVIRVSPDKQVALVISGTGTGPRDIPHVVIDPARRVAKPLCLRKKTYFYQSAIHIRAIEELDLRDNPPLRCPRVLWERLMELALAGAREKLSKKDFSEWWPEAEGEPAPRSSGTAIEPGARKS